MNLSKFDLCESCRDIRYKMGDGSPCPNTWGEILDKASTNPMGLFLVKGTVLNIAEQGLGCPTCVSLVQRAV